MLSANDGPSLDLLRCFALLHDERHVTRAAHRAGLSQPAMSRALDRLRELFDDALFVRTPRGMLPTVRADELAPRVRSVLDAAGALIQPASFAPATLVRTFVIGTSDFFAAELMRRLVSRRDRDARTGTTQPASRASEASAAPVRPARCGTRSVQSMHARDGGRRESEAPAWPCAASPASRAEAGSSVSLVRYSQPSAASRSAIATPRWPARWS